MNEFSKEITMDGVSGIWGWLIGGGILGFSIAMVIVALVCAFFWYIIRAVGYWKAFQKAGKPGWKALIPFYNTYTRYKLTWDAKMFWVSLALIIGASAIPETGSLLVSLLRLVIAIGVLAVPVMSCYKTALAFGHGAGFAVGLFILEPVFALILGLDSSRYEGIK